MSDLTSLERVEDKIIVLRGKKVLLDRDLAKLYDVPTKAFKQAVRRNITRFPKEFMFELTKTEFSDWRSQYVTSNADRMGLRHSPMAFTEHGIAMLSSVLKSEKAIQMNIIIIRAFIHMRKMLLEDKKMATRLDDIENRLGAHEFQTLAVLDQLGAIKKRLTPAKSNKPLIGFPIPEKNN